MKVLVACETSGAVRDAFRALGHDAMSCDILPTDIPGPHYQGDVRDILNNGWDLLIAHPPCTYLCSSGMHWTTRGLRDPQLTEDALDLVRLLMAAPIPRIAIENPVGCISTHIRPADQYIHPHQFGDDASKKTGLWLKGLPPPAAHPAHCAAPRERQTPLVQPDRRRPEQRATQRRPLEYPQQDLRRHRHRHGHPMGRPSPCRLPIPRPNPPPTHRLTP